MVFLLTAQHVSIHLISLKVMRCVFILFSNYRDRITEAKEELSRERSHGGSVISRSARSTPAPCESCQLLQEQVDKLKEMNKIFTEKIKKVSISKEVFLPTMLLQLLPIIMV